MKREPHRGDGHRRRIAVARGTCASRFGGPHLSTHQARGALREDNFRPDCPRRLGSAPSRPRLCCVREPRASPGVAVPIVGNTVDNQPDHASTSSTAVRTVVDGYRPQEGAGEWRTLKAVLDYPPPGSSVTWCYHSVMAAARTHVHGERMEGRPNPERAAPWSARRTTSFARARRGVGRRVEPVHPVGGRVARSRTGARGAQRAISPGLPGATRGSGTGPRTHPPLPCALRQGRGLSPPRSRRPGSRARCAR